jgi:regulator of replication initiation timing
VDERVSSEMVAQISALKTENGTLISQTSKLAPENSSLRERNAVLNTELELVKSGLEALRSAIPSPPPVAVQRARRSWRSSTSTRL